MTQNANKFISARKPGSNLQIIRVGSVSLRSHVRSGGNRAGDGQGSTGAITDVGIFSGNYTEVTTAIGIRYSFAAPPAPPPPAPKKK